MTATMRQDAGATDTLGLPPHTPFLRDAGNGAQDKPVNDDHFTSDDHASDDKEYFYRRAESELEMAQRTIVPEAVKAHYTLAGYYLDKVYSDDQAPAANDAGPPPLGSASGS